MTAFASGKIPEPIRFANRAEGCSFESAWLSGSMRQDPTPRRPEDRNGLEQARLLVAIPSAHSERDMAGQRKVERINGSDFRLQVAEH